VALSNSSSPGLVPVNAAKVPSDTEACSLSEKSRTLSPEHLRKWLLHQKSCIGQMRKKCEELKRDLGNQEASYDALLAELTAE
jgi:hypothetical protein